MRPQVLYPREMGVELLLIYSGWDLGCWDPYLVWKLAVSHIGSLCLSGLICLHPGEKREERD